MNIMEMFNGYHPERIDELAAAIQEVKKSVLEMTERIPSDLIQQFFRPERDELLCCTESIIDEDSEPLDNYLYVFGTDTKFQFGQYFYDDIAAKALNDVLNKHYPSISCDYRYDLDVYKRKITFCFRYGIEIDINNDVILKEVKESGKKPYYVANVISADNLYGIIKVFCKDVSRIVNRDVKFSDWMLEPYGAYINGMHVRSEFNDSGVLYLEFPVD